jgi:hypothetical protein
MSVACTVVVLGILGACAAPAPPPSTPTIQAAATQAVATVQSAASAVAPTAAAAQTQGIATVQSVASAVAPTVVAANATVSAAATVSAPAREATGTALAPTVQAMATRVAPTVQAASTQVTGAIATSVAESPIHIVGASTNPDDITVVLSNDRTVALVLDGWALLMGPTGSWVGLNGIPVAPQQTVTLHFKPGVSTVSDNYLGVISPTITAGLTSGARIALIAPGDRVASIYQIP